VPTASAAERAEIARQVRAASTSFYWAMRLLARPRREAMFAVYAFCRAVDDIADSDQTVARKKALLAEWRGEVHAIVRRPAQQADRPRPDRAGPGLRARAQRLHGGDRGHGDGCRRPHRGADARRPRSLLRPGGLRRRAIVRADLRRAGRDRRCGRDHLGRALQLTNILRDVAEDADDGRLYMPRELLEAHGVPVDDPAAALAHPGFVAGLAGARREAQGQFAATQAILRQCDRRKSGRRAS
jgi:presqualene diphosphate synthase